MSREIKIGEKHIITCDEKTSNPDKYWFIDPNIVRAFLKLSKQQSNWQLKREQLIQKVINE